MSTPPLAIASSSFASQTSLAVRCTSTSSRGDANAIVVLDSDDGKNSLRQEAEPEVNNLFNYNGISTFFVEIYLLSNTFIGLILYIFFMRIFFLFFTIVITYTFTFPLLLLFLIHYYV